MKFYILLTILLCSMALVWQLFILWKKWKKPQVTLLLVIEEISKSHRVLEGLSSRRKFLKDRLLANYFLTTSEVLENLIRSVVYSQPQMRADVTSLEATFYLAKQISHRCERLSKASSQHFSHPKGFYDFDLLYTELSISPASNKIGCYFCSRPYHPIYFRYVDVSVGPKDQKVMACRVCRKELESSGEVKVLSFVADGETKHWTELENYRPDSKYWNKKILHKSRKKNTTLKLIKSDH